MGLANFLPWNVKIKENVGLQGVTLSSDAQGSRAGLVS